MFLSQTLRANVPIMFEEIVMVMIIRKIRLEIILAGNR